MAQKTNVLMRLSLPGQFNSLARSTPRNLHWRRRRVELLVFAGPGLGSYLLDTLPVLGSLALEGSGLGTSRFTIK